MTKQSGAYRSFWRRATGRAFEAIKARPATIRAYDNSPESYSKERVVLSDQASKIPFGQSADVTRR